MSTTRSAATTAIATANASRVGLPVFTADSVAHAAAATEPMIRDRRSSNSEPTRGAETSNGTPLSAGGGFSRGRKGITTTLGLRRGEDEPPEWKEKLKERGHRFTHGIAHGLS